MADDERWKWGKAFVACYEQLKPDLAAVPPKVTDAEIIPSFTGSPDGIACWLICEKARDVSVLRQRAPHFRELFAATMKAKGFPDSAIESFQLDFTSEQDIKDGGGRFAYFR
jgi:hypothetical protein